MIDIGLGRLHCTAFGLQYFSQQLETSPGKGGEGMGRQEKVWLCLV